MNVNVDGRRRRGPAERVDQLKKWPIWRLRNRPTTLQAAAVEESDGQWAQLDYADARVT
jgi:hypothetical protein